MLVPCNWLRFAPSWLLFVVRFVVGLTYVVASLAPLRNVEILMDSYQINPGDPFGNQASKYTNMQHLHSLGYSARTSSMEQSPAFCLDYNSADRVPSGGVFSYDQKSLAWAQAYCQGMNLMIEESVSAGLEMYFFTDMVVFPLSLIKIYPEVVHPNTTSTIQWNNWTEYLLTVMFDEWFERFPLTHGIVVRTGETYTFDTPYHAGSSPIVGMANITDQQDVWIHFLQLLCDVVCIKHGRKVIFRTWYTLTSVDYYRNVTDHVTPHELLYFSVKHTSGDFLRQMPFNDILGLGNHAQILEVQIQREYEGKGSFPLYIFEHIVLGDESSGSNKSVADLFPSGRDESSIIKGLWTWSRGGGWWGPYIHGAEFWIDLNLNLFVSWWKSNCTTTDVNVANVFQQVCQTLICGDVDPFSYAYQSMANLATKTPETGSLYDVCKNLRDISLLADRALLYGRYCLESGKRAYNPCWAWTRDDRIGGLGDLGSHLEYLRGNDTRIADSLRLKGQSLELWEKAFNLYGNILAPSVALLNPSLDRQLRSSFLYAKSYFCIIESAWRGLVYGELKKNDTSTRPLLIQAIQDYDSCWSVFRATALTNPAFPSIYKGISWNFPFHSENEGIDATIDTFRTMLSNEEDELLAFLEKPPLELGE